MEKQLYRRSAPTLVMLLSTGSGSGEGHTGQAEHSEAGELLQLVVDACLDHIGEGVDARVVHIGV